jgi:hypothetical protein
MLAPRFLPESRAPAVCAQLANQFLQVLHLLLESAQPNCGFNADANIGHRFAILMANAGALQPSASGAG